MNVLSTVFQNLKGFFKIILAVFTGDEDLGKERMKICNSCELRDGQFCEVCGCWLVAKTTLKKEHCPIGRW